MNGLKLETDFYRREDVVEVAHDLVGKVLCTRIDGDTVTAGMITETEAYCGRNDRACHANNGLRTQRTETMYRAGGVSYIYLCYGIHHLFNVVTNREGLADAVLVRGIKPLDGIETMKRRRMRTGGELSPALTAGPGRLTQALGIVTGLDGTSLLGDRVWIEDRSISLPGDEISRSPRIGVDYAGEHAKRPWRFFLRESDWVSR